MCFTFNKCKQCEPRNHFLFYFSETVLDCIAAGTLNPYSIYRCVSDAIGIDSSCHDCICYVMEKLGFECKIDDVRTLSDDIAPIIEIIR